MPSNRIPVVLAQVAVAAGIAALGIQGYLIARPQSLNQLLAFLEDEGGRRSYG